MPWSSRIALGVALSIAGSFGLAVALLVPRQSADAVKAEPPRRSISSSGVGSGEAVPPPITDELVKFCAGHVTGQRSFVVFSRGTCVVVNEPCQDPLAEARKVLQACADPNTPFIPEKTAEGDLIVSFKEPVFQRFTEMELLKLGPWLDKLAPALLSPSESMSAGKDWTPPDQAKAGLLARRRMLEDASTAVAVKIIRAKTKETASR